MSAQKALQGSETETRVSFNPSISRKPSLGRTVVSKFSDYRNSDGISSEGKSSDYSTKILRVTVN